MSKWGRKTKKEPEGYEIVSSTIEALNDELRERMNETHIDKPKNELMWPVHQINWQRSRYVFDMYYLHKRIPKPVYDYCVELKYVDAALAAKWKKPAYSRLCCTYVINTRNYPYGTVGICRVPRFKLKEGTVIRDHFSGCRGCASGDGGYANIFGNRYGQRLAKIQILREKMQLEEEEKERLAEEERLKAEQEEEEDKEEEEENEDGGDGGAKKARVEGQESGSGGVGNEAGTDVVGVTDGDSRKRKMVAASTEGKGVAAAGRDAVWGSKEEQAAAEKDEEAEASAASAAAGTGVGGMDQEAMQALQAFNSHGTKANKPKGRR